MKKRIISTAIIFSLFAIVFFLLLSFVAASFNITTWHEGLRVTFASFTGISLPFAIGMALENN
jgi:hypothetical protein